MTLCAKLSGFRAQHGELMQSDNEIIRKRDYAPVAKDYLSQETPLEVVFKTTDPVEQELKPLHPQIEQLFDALAEALALDRPRQRKEVEKLLAPLRVQIAALEGKVAELNGMITVMLQVFQTKDTDKQTTG